MTPTPTTITSASRRELSQRSADGIEVTLYWDETRNAISVEVRDVASDEAFEITVPSARALDAFQHPYVYAASVEHRGATRRRRASAGA